MIRIYKAPNDLFDPDIVVCDSKIKGWESFWDIYEEVHYPSGKIRRKND